MVYAIVLSWRWRSFGAIPCNSVDTWTSTHKCWFWGWLEKITDYFNRGRGDINEFGSIIYNSVQLCKSYLTNSHVEFIRRQTNAVAHELTKAAASSPKFRIFYKIPTCITDLIFSEMI